MLWLWCILAALALLLAVALLRAARFTPKPQGGAAPLPFEPDGGRAVESLRRMVRVPTVSRLDKSLEDPAPFEAFPKLLEELYPNVHKACSLEKPGPRSLLYLWKGKSGGAPTVLMAHYDVVPADGAAWEKPPFEGVIENGLLWGRGTLDTKITLCGVMEAAEALIARGFVPENDVYFSFGGDEEIAGEGAPAIVRLLEERGVRPALVVDEGGAVVEGVFPGVAAPCALVGTGEKGLMDVELSMVSQGGHASAPPPHTLVGRLARAAVRVEAKPFPSRLTRPAAEMFDTLGRHSTFLYRLIFANLWLFRPVLDSMCKKKGGELNALLRTTCAFTMMEGSPATNVLPPAARMVANLRLVGGDTTESAVEYLKRAIGDPDIAIRKLHGSEPSPFSDTASPGWAKLKAAIRGTWPEALVSPYLMIACSDSRHFCRICGNVMRFSAMALTTAERGYIHGHNERVPLKTIETTVAFYLRLLALC